MSTDVVIDLFKINSKIRQNVVDDFIKNATNLGLLFRADFISNKLIVYCDNSNDKNEFLRLVVLMVAGLQLMLLVRYSKRFLIYGISKRSLGISQHNDLCNLVFSNLASMNLDVQFLPADIKVSHYVEGYAVILVYNADLANYLYSNNGLRLIISRFSTLVYKYPHF